MQSFVPKIWSWYFAHQIFGLEFLVFAIPPVSRTFIFSVCCYRAINSLSRKKRCVALGLYWTHGWSYEFRTRTKVLHLILKFYRKSCMWPRIFFVNNLRCRLWIVKSFWDLSESGCTSSSFSLMSLFSSCNDFVFHLFGTVCSSSLYIFLKYDSENTWVKPFGLGKSHWLQQMVAP